MDKRYALSAPAGKPYSAPGNLGSPQRSWSSENTQNPLASTRGAAGRRRGLRSPRLRARPPPAPTFRRHDNLPLGHRTHLVQRVPMPTAVSHALGASCTDAHSGIARPWRVVHRCPPQGHRTHLARRAPTPTTASHALGASCTDAHNGIVRTAPPPPPARAYATPPPRIAPPARRDRRDGPVPPHASPPTAYPAAKLSNSKHKIQFYSKHPDTAAPTRTNSLVNPVKQSD